MASRKVTYEIGFSVNQSGLKSLYGLAGQFETIAKSAGSPGQKLNESLIKSKNTAADLMHILEKSIDFKTNALNMNTFTKELKQAGYNAQTLKKNLGPENATAFNNLGSSVLRTNIQLKESNKLLDSLALTMSNTIKWGITSSIFNNITSSISRAVTYVKQLDTSLNNIRIVTGKSSEEMAKFAEKANEAAKRLGTNTTAYTNAALIYEQQGLGEQEVEARTEVTLKVANVTQQSAQQVSEQLTAVWNGYQVSAEEAEKYIDKLSAVAATTATDLEELSTAMGKVASAANSMGVDIDQLNAHLAIVTSTTRQAPESVGTAFKTIYARMADLKLGKEDEDGLQLGEVSGGLKKMGVDILDAEGNLKDLGGVIEEVGNKWQYWNEAQRIAIAQLMAGKRQYNNLIALFANWDQYDDILETSKNSLGTLQDQQDIFLDSTTAKLNKLKATLEGLYANLINSDELGKLYDIFGNLVESVSNFAGAFGGGFKTLSAFGLMIANIFNKQITKSITKARIEQQKYTQSVQLLEQQRDFVNAGVQSKGKGATNYDKAVAAGYEKQIGYMKQILALRSKMTSEEYNSLVNMAAETAELEKQHAFNEMELDDTLNKLELGEEDKTKIKAGNLTIEDVSERMGKETKAEREKLKQEKELTEEEKKQIDNSKQKIAAIDAQIKKEQEYVKILQERKKIYNSKIGEEERQIISKNTLKNLKELDGADAQFKNRGLINEENISAKIAKLNVSIENSKKNRIPHLKDINQIEAQVLERNQEIDKKIEEINKKEKEQSELLNNSEEKLRNFAKTQSEAANEAERTKQNIKAIAKTSNLANVFSGVLSGLSSLTMAFGSLSSLMDTFNNEELNFGEKITQSIMSLGMAIPMLISSFKSLKTVMMGNLTQEQLLSAEMMKNKAITDGATMSLFKNKVAIQGKKLSTSDLTAALQSQAIAQGVHISQLDEETITTTTLAVAQKANITLTKEQALAVGKLTAAQKALNVAQKANIIMLVISLVLGAITAVSSLMKKQKEQREKEKEQAEERERERKEAAKALAEENREKIKEIRTNEELLFSYVKLRDEYETNISVKEDLQKQAEAVAEAYEIENGVLLAQAGAYDLLAEKATAAAKEKAKQGQSDAYQAMSTSKTAYEDNVNTNKNKLSGGYLKDYTTDKFVDVIANDEAAKELQAWNNFVEQNKDNDIYNINAAHPNEPKKINYEKMQKDFEKFYGPFKYGQRAFEGSMYFSDFAKTSKDTIKNNENKLVLNVGKKREKDEVELLENIRNDLILNGDNYTGIYNSVTGSEIGGVLDFNGLDITDPAYYKKVLDIYNNMNDKNSNLYVEEDNREDNEVYKIISDFIANNKEPYEQYASDVNVYGAASVINENFDNIQKASNADNYEDFVNNNKEVFKAIEDFVKKNEGVYEGDAITLLKEIYGDTDSVYAQDYIKAQEFQNSLTDENTKAYFQNLSSEDQKDAMKLYVTGVIDQDATQAEIENGLENLKYSLDYDTTNLEMTATLRDKVVEGEDFEEELKQLREYNGMEYKEELEGFEEKSLKDKLEILEKITNEQQEQNLLAIAMKKDEKESEVRLKNKMAMEKEISQIQATSEEDRIKQVQEIKDKFAQSLEEELSKIDLEIELELNTQILDYYSTQVDTIIGRTELLQKATEMIGEGWTIASEDARAFGNMYPELLDGCDILADGTIKLNQEMVKSKLEGDQAEIESDTTKLVTEMENQKTILGIQQKYAQRELEIIEATLNGEYSKSDSEKLIQDNLSAYKEEISAYDTDVQVAGQEATISNAEKASNEIQGHFNAVGEKLVQIQEAYRKLFTSEDINTSDFKEILKSTEKAQNLTSGKTALVEYFDEKEYTTDERKDILNKYYGNSREDSGALNQLAEDRLRLIQTIEDAKTGQADLTAGISEILGNAAKSKKGIENAGKSDEERDKEGKEYKDEFDRYWELNKVIEKTENELDKLSEMENHLFGKDLQKNLKETNKLLQNQIQHHKDLYAEQQREQKELQNILSTYGMSFDDKGNITNYLEVTKQMTDEYNALVSSYNNFGIDENQFNLGEEQFELFKETLERYDDLFYSEMVETLNNIDDEAREIIENNLKGWEAVIEVELDKEEFERDWNTFLKEMNEDFRKHYKDLNKEIDLISLNSNSYRDTMNITGQKVADIQADLERIRTTGQGELYLTESEALEALREAEGEYQDAIRDFVNSAQEAWDVYLEGIDQAYEKIDELMSQYDRLNEQLEFQGQLIELIYGEEAYGLIEQLNAAKADTGLSQLRAIQAELDATNAAIAKEIEGTEAYVKLQEKQIELQSALNDKVLEMVQLYKDDLTNSINKAIAGYEKLLTGGTNFDYMNEQWERLRENSDFTLNATERAYEILSLSNNIQKDINALTDNKDKQRLNAALEEELSLLREKELLTQHDVNMAQARLDILKAEMALEDARNSKNSMKLTRGADGNWSYQYVADEEDIREKTQTYIDSWNECKNIAEEGYIEITEKITKLNEDTKAKLLEIMNIEDEAERNRQLLELQQWHNEQMDALAKEYNLRQIGYIQANYGAYKTFTSDTILSFEDMQLALSKETGEMYLEAQQFAEKTLPEMTSIAAGFSQSWNGDGELSAKNQFKIAMESIFNAFVDYQNRLDGLSNQTGIAFGEKGIAGAISNATSGVADLETAIRKLCSTELGGKLDTLRGKFTKLYEEIHRTLVELGIIEDKSKNPITKTDTPKKSETPSSQPTVQNPTPTQGAGGSSRPAWNRIEEVYNKINTGAWKETGEKARIERGRKEGYSEEEVKAAQKYINLIYEIPKKGQGIPEAEAKKMMGYDTGGYTGTWGSSGKLAILHEKELVLNKRDTANILEAVKATRTDFIDRMMFSRLQNSMQLMSAQLEMAAKYNSFKNAIGKECDCPNQIFNVTAEFPAANSVAEIREAILSLPGLASQKVGMRSYSRV